MATEAEIGKIARLLWTERGKPEKGPMEFREHAKQLLDDRDAICCPVQDTANLLAKRPQRLLAGTVRSEPWPRRSDANKGQITAAGCDPAAEASDVKNCLDAIDAALSAARREPS